MSVGNHKREKIKNVEVVPGKDIKDIVMIIVNININTRNTTQTESIKRMMRRVVIER